MADQVSDGKIKVGWVTTLSSVPTPTVAQVTAGIDLEGWITPDGLAIEIGEDEVDTSKLNSKFNSKRVGRGTPSMELTFFQQGKGSAPYTTFNSQPDGWLVVRYDIDSETDWAAGQIVEVYPCKAGDQRLIPPAENDSEKFSVALFPTADYDDDAVIAA